MSEQLFDDPRITAMGLFTEAFTGLTARISEQVAGHGVSVAEYEVLIRLVRSPQGQLRMTELAAQTQLTTSGITRVVDRLERTGLVCRSACATDRRSSYAVITDAGRQRLQNMLPDHLALIDHWFTGRLEPDQLEHMLDALRTIRDAVRPGATSGAATTTSRPANSGAVTTTSRPANSVTNTPAAEPAEVNLRPA